MLIADSFDEGTNKTTLTLVPYGNIEIPGKWAKSSYNEVSKQHFFKDAEQTSLAVAKNPQSKFPFFTEGMSDMEFSTSFFKWEKEHYEKQGFKIEELEQITNEDFVLWKATENSANTIFLYGSKNGFAYNFALFTDNWTDDQRIEFLAALYESN